MGDVEKFDGLKNVLVDVSSMGATSVYGSSFRLKQTTRCLISSLSYQNWALHAFQVFTANGRLNASMTGLPHGGCSGAGRPPEQC